MRTLYGNFSDNCCGYCKLHHVGVTVRQMRLKQCLEKQCTHFRRLEEHPHWTWLKRKETKKQESKLLRKQHKEKQKAYLENLSKGHRE